MNSENSQEMIDITDIIKVIIEKKKSVIVLFSLFLVTGLGIWIIHAKTVWNTIVRIPYVVFQKDAVIHKMNKPFSRVMRVSSSYTHSTFILKIDHKTVQKQNLNQYVEDIMDKQYVNYIKTRLEVQNRAYVSEINELIEYKQYIQILRSSLKNYSSADISKLEILKVLKETKEHVEKLNFYQHFSILSLMSRNDAARYIDNLIEIIESTKQSLLKSVEVNRQKIIDLRSKKYSKNGNIWNDVEFQKRYIMIYSDMKSSFQQSEKMMETKSGYSVKKLIAHIFLIGIASFLAVLVLLFGGQYMTRIKKKISE